MENPLVKIGDSAKAHPGMAIALVAGAVVIGLWLSSGSGGGSGSSGQASGSSDLAPGQLALMNAELQAQGQQDQIQAYLAAQGNDLTAKLTALSTQAATAISLATIQQQTQMQANQYAYKLGAAQLDVAKYQSDLSAGIQNNSINSQRLVQLAQIDSNNTVAALNADTTIKTNTIAANLQQQVAKYTTDLQGLISNNQTKVAIKQIQATVDIAKIGAGSSLLSGLFGLGGSVIKALI